MRNVLNAQFPRPPPQESPAPLVPRLAATYLPPRPVQSAPTAALGRGQTAPPTAASSAWRISSPSGEATRALIAMEVTAMLVPARVSQPLPDNIGAVRPTSTAQPEHSVGTAVSASPAPRPASTPPPEPLSASCPRPEVTQPKTVPPPPTASQAPSPALVRILARCAKMASSPTSPAKTSANTAIARTRSSVPSQNQPARPQSTTASAKKISSERMNF